MPNACPDYPNGFIYCHQCSKKRDPKEKDPEKDKPKEKSREKPPRQRRCVAKYCKFCLKNRYDVEFDDVVNAARNARFEPGHIDSAGYFYRCPKCSDTCNCPRCRKSKGLEPMGFPAPKPSASKSKADRQSKKHANGDSASTAKGAKGPRKPKVKPLPIVEWTPVPVRLPLYEAEARFHIREFVLRFADLFEPSLPRTNLEELEEIGGGRHQGRDEHDDMVSWVSEFCVKSIIVGLLNLLAKELQGPLSLAIKNAVKEIRNLGVNLNKIWPVLATLRDSPPPPDPLLFTSPHSTLPGSSSPFTFTFPDPLSPPSSLDIRTIRSTRTNATTDNYGIHIAYSAQMVPVVEALMEDVLMTTAVREELEEGVREGMKETIKEQKEAVKRETERWDVVRKSMETRVKLKAQILENRAKREYHKLKNVSLENSLKTLVPKYAARFTPLGMDSEDRVYWILSPGVSEREAAQDFIMSCSSDDKLIKSNRKKIVMKKARVLNMEERIEMRSWSWFLAVWGKRPEDAAVGSGGQEEEEEEDKDREGWWGFYEPLEILKLSEWISMKAGLDDENKDSNISATTTVPLSASLHSLHPHPQQKLQELKNLVEELRAFAVLLEWRCREDKYEGVLKDLEAAAGGAHNLGSSVVGSGSGSSVGGGEKGKAKAREEEMEVDEEKEEEEEEDNERERSESGDESESGSGSESSGPSENNWNSQDEDVSMA
ncbi:hypothetical protein AGABI1DRAFT_80849 [Agaricus bisporus var. burnettii JB137-S8]|uniref:Zinc-finger domain-containing protein n=1 Tax=Agaricus bisporus var. burnettii (strain JB137-S8 / ATCC MYA-4627 / FGSC 10392) TaxID=597362 RepID=K5XJK5_AGABU|nr:uncharacterized protein AGABI1DRAFT_80849 [Agaricus bisporus var. burnettii JB137-S8]EKM74655.1 hypothetical protein AGABI1DRAFT_80849 [Agaricus bisporus var. burnettii JB137-S8]